MRKMDFGLVVCVAAIVTSATGCPDTGPSPATVSRPAVQTGSAAVTVRPESVWPSAITAITLDVQPANLQSSLVYDSAEGRFSGVVVLPVGMQTFTATAWAAGVTAGVGSASALIDAGTTSLVHIVILDVSGPVPVIPRGPAILNVVVSNRTPVTGEVISLSVNAQDPDGDVLTYAWSDDCANSYFGAPASSATTWVRSTPGVCNVEIVVSDGGLSDSEIVQIGVLSGAGGDGAAAIQGYFVPQPVIEYVNVVRVNDAWTYRQVDRYAGLDATVRDFIRPGGVVEIEGYGYFGNEEGTRVVSITETAGCGAVPMWQDFSDTDGTSSWFDARWQAPSAPALCAFDVTVENDGLVDSFPLAVAVSGCHADDEGEENDTAATAWGFDAPFASYPFDLTTAIGYSDSGTFATDMVLKDHDWYRFPYQFTNGGTEPIELYWAVDVVGAAAINSVVGIYAYGVTELATGAPAAATTITVAPGAEIVLYTRVAPIAPVPCENGHFYDLEVDIAVD